jgi:glucose/arabinose dehydrogenase
MRRIVMVAAMAASVPAMACAQDSRPTGSAAAASGAAAPAGDGGVTATTLGGRLRVPPGFTVTEWAQVGGPRFMALAPDGAVYVSRPGARVVDRLEDKDGDGRAESRTTAVSGLTYPHGVAIRDGRLYVAMLDAVVRTALGGDGRASARLDTLARYTGGGGHRTRTVVFGADGAMYVSIGSSCNVCIEKDADRATVMRYDANGKNGRVFARGLRNAVGLAVNPATRQLWATTHERDNLRPEHQDLPPEEIDILRDGADYGWPYCWGDRQPNPEFGDKARCERTVAPALAMQAHSAPLDITFLDRASTFPRDWRGDALVAFHGSWNRDEPTGAKVVRVRVRDGRPVSYEEFIVGFQQEDGSRWGRPAGLLVLKDGSVLVSDDQGGRIWRVTYSAPK